MTAKFTPLQFVTLSDGDLPFKTDLKVYLPVLLGDCYMQKQKLVIKMQFVPNVLKNLFLSILN
jgi:hypothetical protein